MPTISTLTVDVESKTSKFSTGLKTVLGGLSALAVGAGYAFKQFEDSEKVANQTTAVLESTGNAAGVTAKHVSDLANALAEKAGIDDEAIQTGENMILTFKNIANEAGKGNAIFDRTTKVVTDMSVAMGQDFKSSAIQVGKALNDPIAGMSALSRVGVTFSAEQKKQITQMENHNNLLGAQKIILQELTSEFGGSAAAQATATGKMSVALGNLAETVGGLLAPAITLLVSKFMVLVSWLQSNAGPIFQQVQAWFAGIMEKLQPVTEFLAGVAVDAWHALSNAVRELWPDIQKLWKAIEPGAKVLGIVAAAIIAVALKAIPPLISIIAKVIDSAVKMITAFVTVGNKIGGVVVAIVGFFVKLWNGARDNFEKVVSFVKDIPDKIKGFFAAAGSWLLQAGKSIMLGLWNGIKSMFTTIWNGLTSWVSGLIDHVKSFLHIGSPSKVFEEIGRNMMLGMDQGIRGAASDVSRTLAGVVPSGALGMTGAGGVTVNVYGDVTGDEIIRKVNEGLTKHVRRGGRLGFV